MQIGNKYFYPHGRRVVDLTGYVYNRITVLSYFGKKGKNPYWNCQCWCGNIFEAACSRLTRGTLKHCGCQTDINHRKHGMAYSTENTIYSMIKGRCYNPKTKEYPRYGGRGITVCPRWLGANGRINFFKDMGPRPSLNHSVDRIDNNGNYEPTNCRWATRKQQSSNTRMCRYLEYGVEKFHLAKWAVILNIPEHTIRTRADNGIDIEGIIKEKGILYPKKEREFIPYSFGHII